MSLSDLAIRQAKATGQAYTLPDIDGLSLAVTAEGGKSWHFRYYWLGKQKRMSLGTYPEIGLRDARALRDEARALLAKGINPHQERKRRRAEVRLADEHTFRAVYEKWCRHRELQISAGTLEGARRIFDRDVLPTLGERSIYHIKRADLIDVVAKIEARSALSIADKVRTWLRLMWRYALVVVPDLESNPATDLDVVAMPLPPVSHNPLLRMPELPRLMQRIRSYRGRLVTQFGVRLLLLTGVRTGELLQATPEQFDLDAGLWKIPPDAVKQLQLEMRKKRIRPQDMPPYIVPLPVQAIEIVRYLLDQFKPAQRFLLRGDHDVTLPMSNNTLNQALHRMGFKSLLTGHGIRGTISTALHELGYLKAWIDAQLSHVDPDATSASYNHAEYVEQRRAMMQDWADRLDLFEQGHVERASQRLIVQFQAVPAASSDGAAASTMVSPMLIVTQPRVGSTESDGATRLPAVPAPRSAMLPVLSGVQREQLALIDIFEAPHNLPAVDFAQLAGKSKRWINYEVSAGNLLALNLGNRGRRIPDWHLDPVKHALIQAVMKLARSAEPWEIYHALAAPRAILNGRAAVDAVTTENTDELIAVVSNEVRTGEWSALRAA
ncbi:tyrosine-type recombinase/integrase [Chitinimonas lacunae]|uniref:Tyrosine-type recombinase/integrase n=1 Tax=Chitinimonas lacunae TaxID=1963018 RepID=A0ABV8MTS6_9NEIS